MFAELESTNHSICKKDKFFCLISFETEMFLYQINHTFLIFYKHNFRVWTI